MHNNKLLIILFISIPFLISSISIKNDSFESKIYRFTFSNNQNFSLLNKEMKLTELQSIVKKYLLEAKNPMDKIYQEQSIQWIVEDFFTKKTKSQEIADTILLYTAEKNLPISIVFSLVFVESSFSSKAVSYNANSVDLGLFQLNSRTFRHLKKEDFFHLETNVKMGLGYLEYAFKLDPDPKIALAIYNAGPSRPLRGQIPESTSKYVSRIIDYSKNLDKEFIQYVWNALHLSDLDRSEV